MPSSTLVAIEPVLQLIIDLNPMSILDMGIGFGKWGLLAREYLETYRHGVVERPDWKVRIDGIEIFEPYVQEHQRAVYSNLYIADLDSPEARQWLARSRYQLYIAMDVLEHLRNWKELLKAVPKGRAIIAAVPEGESPQGPVFGNVHETHVVTLQAEDLKPYFENVITIGRKLLCYSGINVQP